MPRPAAPSAKTTSAEHAHELVEKLKRRKGDPNQIKIRLGKTEKLGFAIAGGVAVITLIFVLHSRGTIAENDAAKKAIEDAKQEVMDKLASYDLTSEAQCAQLIAYAEENTPKWKGTQIAQDVINKMAQAKTSMDQSKERAEMRSRLDNDDAALKTPEKLDPARIKEVKSDLEELVARAEAVLGKADLDRVNALLASTERIYCDRLFATAKNEEETKTDKPRVALNIYYQAEDAIRDALTNATKMKKSEDEAYYKDVLQKAIGAADHLIEQVFSDEGSENMGWKALLEGEQAGLWSNNNAPGFSRLIQGGVLSIVGPDSNSNKQAVISIGDREQWRNYVLEIEYTLESGWFEMYFRLGTSPNPNTPSLRFEAEKNDGKTSDNVDVKPKLGEKHRLRISLLGSTFKTRDVTEYSTIDKPETALGWTKRRKGAVGLLIPPGTRVKFTDFKIRELL